MNERFLKFIPLLLDLETEYNRDGSVRTEHDPDDPGGTTKFGIDQRSHPKENIASLTEDGAKRIYFAEWEQAPIDELPPGIGECLFDIRVNGGPGAEWLQGALSVTADGFIGPQTISAAQNLSPEQRGLVVKSMCQARANRFNRLSDNNPRLAKFRNGWLARNKRVLDYCLPLALA